VVGIVLATFLSDFCHEAVTAVLPLYLTAVGLGPGALGIIEGVADFFVSLSKLGGGLVGHRVRHKRPWAALGYLVTTLATAAIGLVQSVTALLTFRIVAWVGRGFRGPLRDDLLASAVAPTHYGRAFGLERAGDMLGAVAGPVVTALLVLAGVDFGVIILWTLVPGLLAAAAMFLLTKEPAPPPAAESDRGGAALPTEKPSFPAIFWLFLAGVLFFGLGDFSRTFLILLAARDLGETGVAGTETLSVAVLLYALHNLVSAAAAYGIGHRADRSSKSKLLLAGYALGVATNVLLALVGGSLAWLTLAILLSGIYIAAAQTLEKAVAAELLPPALRSLGFGWLAFAGAVGDMASSLYVGGLLQVGQPMLAFLIAAGLGMIGVFWVGSLLRQNVPAPR
jgi:MFS family permease